MANLVRIFSARRSKSFKDKMCNKFPDDHLKPDQFRCIIEMLDGTESTFILMKKENGSILYKRVFHLLDLQEEQVYFGLQYKDANNRKFWLNPQKPILKQCKVSPNCPCHFRLCVKYFASDPRSLYDEMTRYLYVCHIRRAIRDGEYRVDYDTAVHLAALILQSELGDYREGEHDSLAITSHPFLPSDKHTLQFENDVYMKFVSMRNHNITPALADKMFLNLAMRLPDYGIERHTVVAKEDGEEYELGISSGGLFLYRGDNMMGLFSWQNMTTLEFSGRRLRIVAKHNENVDEEVMAQHLMTFVFLSTDKRACKHLWKSSMEHHCFFRLQEPTKPPSRLHRLLRSSSSFHSNLQHTEHSLQQCQEMKLATGSSEARSSYRFQRRSFLTAKSSNQSNGVRSPVLHKSYMPDGGLHIQGNTQSSCQSPSSSIRGETVDVLSDHFCHINVE